MINMFKKKLWFNISQTLQFVKLWFNKKFYQVIISKTLNTLLFDIISNLNFKVFKKVVRILWNLE